MLVEALLGLYVCMMNRLPLAGETGKSTSPVWLPPGVHTGRWRGPSLFPLRPPFLHGPQLGRELLEREGAEVHLSSSPAPAAVRGSIYLDNGRVRRFPDGVRALSDEQARKRLAAPALERRRATEDLVIILTDLAAVSGLAKKMLKNGEALTADSLSVNAALEPKSTGTLLKRLSSLRLYRKWCISRGLDGVVIDEELAFEYAAYLTAELTPASRCAAFCEALNFVGSVFEIDVAAVASSKRLAGLATRNLKRKEALRQRDPLTVDMIKLLEAAAVEPPCVDSVLAGSALFCLYGRVRVGDAKRCTCEPSLDLDEHGGGHLEAFFLEHKTARPGSKQALPIVCPVRGITGQNWAKAWLESRLFFNLNAKSDRTLLPAPGVDHAWSSAPMETLEFGAALRDLLRRRGVLQHCLGNVGSHSLKATLLAWLARAGVPRESRKILGYHKAPEDRSLRSYSRDEVAAPLREMVAVIENVKTGAFQPDATRSGFIAKQVEVVSDSDAELQASLTNPQPATTTLTMITLLVISS